MEVVASLSQGRTAAAQCGLFTDKSFPVIFEPPCITGFYGYIIRNSTQKESLSIFMYYSLLSFHLLTIYLTKKDEINFMHRSIETEHSRSCQHELAQTRHNILLASLYF